MKSAVGSRPSPSRNRTLRRGATVATLHETDLRWFYAGWRQGAFAGLLPPPGPQHTVAGFCESFYGLLETYHYAWVLHAPVGSERRPVGVAFGRDGPLGWGAVVALSGMQWLPWASPRRRLEASVAMMQRLRRELTLIIPVPHAQQKFFVHLARYGLLRRIGTVHDVRDEPVALFQTRLLTEH